MTFCSVNFVNKRLTVIQKLDQYFLNLPVYTSLWTKQNFLLQNSLRIAKLHLPKCAVSDLLLFLVKKTWKKMSCFIYLKLLYLIDSISQIPSLLCQVHCRNSVYYHTVWLFVRHSDASGQLVWQNKSIFTKKLL